MALTIIGSVFGRTRAMLLTSAIELPTTSEPSPCLTEGDPVGALFAVVILDGLQGTPGDILSP